MLNLADLVDIGDCVMKGLRQITPYVAGAQPQEKGMIKINTNEHAFSPSPAVLAALREFDGNGLRKYSSIENDSLRSALAKLLGVHQDQIIVGNGSDDILALAFLSFLIQMIRYYFLISPTDFIRYGLTYLEFLLRKCH